MTTRANRKPSLEVATLSALLVAQTPTSSDHESTETWCVVATQPGKGGRGRFVYATAQTETGACYMASSVRERGTSNKRGYLRPCVDIKVIKLDTPAYRAADYMMTPAEREAAIAA
jgi:hypothetical protein